MKHTLPNKWVKCALLSDIHLTPQFLFQIDKQSPGKPWRRMRTCLDQQIDVAFLACVSPREGTEHDAGGAQSLS